MVMFDGAYSVCMYQRYWLCHNMCVCFEITQKTFSKSTSNIGIQLTVWQYSVYECERNEIEIAYIHVVIRRRNIEHTVVIRRRNYNQKQDANNLVESPIRISYFVCLNMPSEILRIFLANVSVQ